MKDTLIKILKTVGLYKTYKIPTSVSNKFTQLDSEKKKTMELLADAYCKSENYDNEANRLADKDALLYGRLNKFRNLHTPFLVESIGLQGKKVLEIGCGSGASSVAMAEQGALLTGIDVDTDALELAEKRVKLYNQKVELLHLNASEVDQLEEKNWDVILFFASIEHMTPTERQVSLQKAFSVLKPGGHLCILGTPNRLWPVDTHTSWMPFYMWLQDELALKYAKFSPRTEFQKIHTRDLNEAHEAFYRWGRGVSFHEIELALDSQAPLKVVGCLPMFLRRYSFIQKWSYKRSPEYKFKSAMAHYGPKHVHPAFYECYLDLIIEK